MRPLFEPPRSSHICSKVCASGGRPFARHSDLSQAYAFALTKTSDEDGLRSFHALIGSVLDELELHASFAAKWGINIQDVSLLLCRAIEESAHDRPGFAHLLNSLSLYSVRSLWDIVAFPQLLRARSALLYFLL